MDDNIEYLTRKKIVPPCVDDSHVFEEREIMTLIKSKTF